MPERTKGRKRNRQQAKDRVLQARIPEQLDEELRGRAEQLGLSVSTIVRNVLLNTFDLVEGVVSDSSQIARALARQEPGHEPDTPDSNTEPTIIGWQEAVLNQNGVCEQCNVILPTAQRAAIGVPAGSRATLLCLECLSTLSPAPAKSAKPATPKKAKKRASQKTSAGRKKSGE
ncbi:MAG: hypothetical protein ACI9JM_002504 [Halioglobus sp.]|jgi:hypothetical protein